MRGVRRKREGEGEGAQRAVNNGAELHGAMISCLSQLANKAFSMDSYLPVSPCAVSSKLPLSLEAPSHFSCRVFILEQRRVVAAVAILFHPSSLCKCSVSNVRSHRLSSTHAQSSLHLCISPHLAPFQLNQRGQDRKCQVPGHEWRKPQADAQSGATDLC